MRRIVPFALSLSLLLGLAATSGLIAQEEKKEEAKSEAKADEKKSEAPKTDEKKADAPKTDEKKADEKKADTKKADTKKADTKKAGDAATESTPPPIPPEVEAKLEAARRAVAEAIVAAQDAGLVQTTIDPPPILDILITGRANDEQTLKSHSGVSPEVFGAWYTGYGKTQGINPEKDVRITNPTAGLKSWYDQRANLLSRHIKAVRDAKGGAKPPKAEEKKDEAKKAEEPKKTEEKKDEAKKTEEKSDQAK